MENKLNKHLETLINHKVVPPCDIHTGGRYISHNQSQERGVSGDGEGIEVGKIQQGTYSSVSWIWLDSGGFLVESFRVGIFSRRNKSEYIDISEFFTDIHHPTDDELDLLGVVHPWAPPAILLLGEGLEYLMKTGRCVKI